MKERLYESLDSMDSGELVDLIDSIDDEYLETLAKKSNKVADIYGNIKYDDFIEKKLYFEAAEIASRLCLGGEKVKKAAEWEYETLMKKPTYMACETAARISNEFKLGEDKTDHAARMAFDIRMDMDMEYEAETLSVQYALLDKFGVLSDLEYEDLVKTHELGSYNLTGQFESIMDGSMEPEEGMVSDPLDEFKRHLSNENFKLAFHVADRYDLGAEKKVLAMILHDNKREYQSNKSLPGMVGIMYPRRLDR